MDPAEEEEKIRQVLMVYLKLFVRDASYEGYDVYFCCEGEDEGKTADCRRRGRLSV